MRRIRCLNSFIFNYDSPDKILNEQVTLAFYGYPLDFLEKYRTGCREGFCQPMSLACRQ